MMNDLTRFSPDFSSNMTMTSVEIAQLCGKRHCNGMRVADALKDKGILLAPQIEGPYTGGNGRGMNCAPHIEERNTSGQGLGIFASPHFEEMVEGRAMAVFCRTSAPAVMEGLGP